MSELVVPKGWKLKQLDEISKVERGISWKKSEESKSEINNGIPVLRIGNIQENNLDLSNLLYLNGLSKEQFLKNKVSKNDILLVSSNGNNKFVGRACKINKDMNFVYASFLSAIKNTAQDINPDFLLYYLRSPLGKLHIQSSTSTGVGINNLKISELRKMPIIFPTLVIQKQIVAKLDHILGQLEEKKKNILQSHDSSKYNSIIKQSRLFLLRDGFKGNLTKKYVIKENAQELIPKNVEYKILNLPPLELISQYALPKGYVWTTIEKIANVVRGGSPRPAGDPKYFGGNIPWITVNSITKDDNMYLYEGSGFLTEEGKKRSRFVNSETLLLTNSGATLGVPKITKVAGCFNDGVAALLDLKSPTKEYLYYYLLMLTETLRNINQGAAQPNLNTSIIKSIPVPLAPLEHQKIIIKIFSEKLNTLKNISVSLEKISTYKENLLKTIHNLEPSILNDAFSGKLVN